MNGKPLYLDFPLTKTWGATCWDDDVKNVSMNLAFGADESVGVMLLDHFTIVL